LQTVSYATRLIIIVIFQVRRFSGLPPITEMEQINPEFFSKHPDLAKKLKEAYGSVNNIDLYIGGMLESKDGPGELFTMIMLEQFSRLRDADRFWFENVDNR